MACRDRTHNFTLLFLNCRQGDQATPPHTYASSEGVVRAVTEAMPLGSGGSKCRDTARGRVGAARRPEAEGTLQVASQTGPLSTHVQFHGEGVGGEEAQSALWPRLSQSLALKCARGLWNGRPPPTRLPPGFYTESKTQQELGSRGSMCPDPQWVGLLPGLCGSTFSSRRVWNSLCLA